MVWNHPHAPVLVVLLAASLAGFAVGACTSGASADLKSLAEQGDIEAQYRLGVMYEHGQGVRRDYAEALTWYNESAQQGFAKAWVALGRMFESGQGVRTNPVQAYVHYEIADHLGYEGAHELRDDIAESMSVSDRVVAETVASTTLAALMIGDYQKFKQPGAAQETPPKSVDAVMSSLLKPVLTESLALQEATESRRREVLEEVLGRAKQGDADAQYEFGEYVFGDEPLGGGSAAWKWFCLAACQGHANAQYRLGSFYRAGFEPVEENSVKAYMWYTLASMGGAEHASRDRRSVAEEMTPGQVAEAERLAAEWWPDLEACMAEATKITPSN